LEVVLVVTLLVCCASSCYGSSSSSSSDADEATPAQQELIKWLLKNGGQVRAAMVHTMQPPLYAYTCAQAVRSFQASGYACC
jgi:hypothetical protein